jgi:hypothetical protein
MIEVRIEERRKHLVLTHAHGARGLAGDDKRIVRETIVPEGSKRLIVGRDCIAKGYFARRPIY